MSEWKKGSDKVPEPVLDMIDHMKLIQDLLEKAVNQLLENKAKAEVELQKLESQKSNRRTKNG